MLHVLQFLDRHVIGIDIDPESLEIASSNAEYLEVLSLDFMYDYHMLDWDTSDRLHCTRVFLVDLLKNAVGNGLGSV